MIPIDMCDCCDRAVVRGGFMDFIKELQHFVSSLGFRRIQVEGGLLWMKEEEGQLRLIEVIPELLPGQTRVPVSRQEERILHLENQLMIRFGEKTDRLTLMLFRGMPDEKTVEEIAPYPNIWCIDKSSGRLLIYENQRADFYGMKEQLENFLSACREEELSASRRELRRMFRPVNTVLVAANVLVFVVLSMMGNVLDAEFMAQHGAMVWDAVVERGEFYRLFTSTFLHFGVEHLAQNMLILLLIGARLERIIGSPRYLAVYLGSGIAASAASLFVTLAREPYTVSAGASGAIFGVMGGLLFLILKDLLEKRRKRIDEIGLSGMLFVILSALSYGFTTTGVDNAAHVGGLVCGFLLTGILMIRK